MQAHAKNSNPHAVAVIGARGYSGLELCRLLLAHPLTKLVYATATDAGFNLKDSLLVSEPKAAQKLAQVKGGTFDDVVKACSAGEVSTVFLATPIEFSEKAAGACLEAGANVIDLSGAFRLNGKADDYGIVPFAKPLPAKRPLLIANPGCYVTSAIMALKPLVQHDLIEQNSIVIDAKSGTTGAGRKASEGLLFAEVDGECTPYRVGKHQHLPEITAHAGLSVDPAFTTHLLTARRGIIFSIYAKVRPGVTAEQIHHAYAQAFEGYPLVRHAPYADGSKLLSLREVVGTAFTHLSYELVGERLYVFSLIDNLLKGAASQAVENLNRLWDQPIQTSLLESRGGV
jgi:N-acetyl-gamma-glutamyl-phosphate reductase